MAAPSGCARFGVCPSGRERASWECIRYDSSIRFLAQPVRKHNRLSLVVCQSVRGMSLTEEEGVLPCLGSLIGRKRPTIVPRLS